MRRGALVLLGALALIACNAITGASELGVAPAEQVDGQAPPSASAPDAAHQPDAASDGTPLDDVPPPGPRLTLTVESYVPTVDLTKSGTVDWVKWGYSDAVTSVRKAGGRLISDFDTISATSFSDQLESAVTTSWTDGTPQEAGEGVIRYLAIFAPGNTVGDGVRFSIPVTTTPRAIRVAYTAMFSAVTLTAALDDEAMPDLTHTTAAATQGSQTENVRIDVHTDADTNLQIALTITALQIGTAKAGIALYYTTVQ